MKTTRKLFLIISLLCILSETFAQVKPKTEWWLEEPYRIVQTNLREIDAQDFDIGVYINSLTDIGANTVLINVGGIVANYYSDLEFHYRNPYMKFNLIEEVIDRLHNEGIRVIGRFDFSKLNEVHAEKNPDWLYVGTAGKTVNYNGQVHTCVNGGYQQEYSLKILDEALTKFPLDGVFFNMIGYKTRDYSNNFHGICQSDACHARFADWSGGLDLPMKQDMNDPVYRQYAKFKDDTKSELFMRIHDLIKSYGDHIAINTYTHAGTDLYRKEANSHGAFYNGFVPWEYHSAHNVKSALGSWKDKQVSNAAVHFYGFPARHTADARWLTQQRLVQNMIYGAGLDFYCIGRLDNLEDRAVLENVKNVFQFHKKHEKYLHHTLSGNQVLLLSAPGDDYKGIFEMLTENHILFDVMEHWTLGNDDNPRKLSTYQVVILPDVTNLSDMQCELLDDFVEGGGKLLATGLPSIKDEIGNPMDRIRLKSLGVKAEYEAYEKEQGRYYRIFEKDKQRLNSDVLKDIDLVYAWEQGMLCELENGAEGLLGHIPPAMIGPPEKCYYTEVTERPGLIYNEYGKGKTVLIPFKLGTLYHRVRQYGHAELVMKSLTELLGYEESMTTNATPMVEISRQISRDGSFEWYGLMNHTGQLGNGFFAPVPIYNIKIDFKSESPVKSVKSLQSGEKLSFKAEGKNVKVTVPELKELDIILVEY
jgi:hypothetical protein